MTGMEATARATITGVVALAPDTWTVTEVGGAREMDVRAVEFTLTRQGLRYTNVLAVRRTKSGRWATTLRHWHGLSPMGAQQQRPQVPLVVQRAAWEAATGVAADLADAARAARP